MKPAAALFDFDGTLVDTEGPDCALISRMLLEVGIRKTPNEVMKDFIGLPRTEIEGAILARYGVQVPPDWHPRYVEEHFQFPLLQRTLIDLSTDKFYLIQEPGMLIREMFVFRDICS